MTGNTTIKSVVVEGQQGLRFDFSGYLSGQETEGLINEWNRVFTSMPEMQFILVWDCLEMSGYDSEARKRWTQALREMKSQIREIRVITDSSLIRMGASIMAMDSQIEIKVYTS